MTSTPRPIAAIAAELRKAAQQSTYWPEGFSMADELDAHAAEHVCVPAARWPTADEIAAARQAVEFGSGQSVRLAFAAFLDKLDPQADDDVDWRALSVALVDAAAAKDYKAFAAVANRVRAARAALDARRQA